MKFRLFTAIAITAMAIVSCSEETAGIGKSLTDEDDKLQVSTGIFEAHSKSLVIDSIYAQNFDCFFGQIKDPETGTYVKTEFMTKERCYGDSLVPLKMRLQELIEPMNDNLVYYTNYDPEEAGYIREGGIDKKQMFSIVNHTYSDEVRSSKGYSDMIRIALNDPYIAPDGQSYNNYGSYLLQTYYDHPEYFKNSYTFVNKVCPGFNFKIEDGLGVMANINDISMRLFFRYKKSNDEFTNTMMAFAATPEILQTSHVTNDKEGLKELAADNSCTYLKTPSGIFTEVELPVMKIMEGHHNDSLLSVNMTFQRMNSELFENEYLLKAPSMVLMIQKDSLFSFFEKEKTYDYRSSFVSSLNKNTYSFTNMGNIVTLMFRDMFVGSLLDPDWEKKHPDWNKVVLVPVTTILSAAQKTNTAGAATATINGICNNLALTSTKLVGGNTPIKVNVIYAKFNDKK